MGPFRNPLERPIHRNRLPHAHTQLYPILVLSLPYSQLRTNHSCHLRNLRTPNERFIPLHLQCLIHARSHLGDWLLCDITWLIRHPPWVIHTISISIQAVPP
jgi:hypothetical protein